MKVSGFLGDAVVKNPPATQEMKEAKIQPLGWEDPLEKEMATHSSVLPCKIPGTEEPDGLQFVESQKSWT